MPELLLIYEKTKIHRTNNKKKKNITYKQWVKYTAIRQRQCP